LLKSTGVELLLTVSIGKETAPLAFIAEVKVSYHREVILLHVLVNVVRAHNCINVFHWADRIVHSAHVVILAVERNAADSLVVRFVFKKVAKT
jgi:hypothetical protein